MMTIRRSIGVMFAGCALALALGACDRTDNNDHRNEPTQADAAPSTDADNMELMAACSLETDASLALDDVQPPNRWRCGPKGCPAGMSGPYTLGPGSAPNPPGTTICCPAGTVFAKGYGTRGGECIRDTKPKPQPSAPACKSDGSGSGDDMTQLTVCCSDYARVQATYNNNDGCAQCCNAAGLPKGGTQANSCATMCAFKKNARPKPNPADPYTPAL